jgi:hypothetical protein
MPNTTIKLLCLTSVSIFLLARFFDAGSLGTAVRERAQPELSRIASVAQTHTGSDPYAMLVQIERFVPATKPGINRFLESVHDAKELESEPGDATASTSTVPAHDSARHSAHIAVRLEGNITRVRHNLVKLHPVIPRVPWRKALLTSLWLALAYCRHIPTIAYASVAGFILGLIVSRPARRKIVSRNLPASYFAHKSPAPASRSHSAVPQPRPGYEQRGRMIPSGARLVPVASGVRRFIEI